MENSGSKIKKVPLGIPEIDELTHGGVIEGSIILVAGHPGTGKTTLGAKFLYVGAKAYNEPGVYVSFAETRDDFFKYMNLLGFDFKSLEEKGLFKFIGLPTVSDKDAINLFIGIVSDAIKEINAKRLVVDSLSALSVMLSPAQLRAFLHSGLIPLLKNNRITGIIIADIPHGRDFVGFGVEEFIVDGVILMKLVRGFLRYERVMEIRKLRGIEVPIVEIPYIIKRGHGIRPLMIPELEISKRRYISEKPKHELISTGFKTLDKILGGIPPGVQILFTGPSGSGKSVLALHLASKIVDKGFNVTYVSLDESIDTIEYRAKYLGVYDSLSKMKIYSLNPITMTLSEICKEVEGIISNTKPDFIIMDGLKALEKMSNPQIFWSTMIKLISLLKSRRIRAVYVYASEFPKEKIPLDTIVDVILIAELSISVRGITRRLIVWKNRFGETPKRPLHIVIKPFEGVSIE